VVNAAPGHSEPAAFHETVEPSEQVQLHLELAGLGTRSIAFVLDTLLRCGVLAGLFLAVLLILGRGVAQSAAAH
jgi:uncharacterized RDD family membrane protein YckC